MIKEVKAHAKINLTLDVTDRRSNGYHDLRSIMQTISLHDIITLEPTNDGRITVSSNLPYLVTDSRNLAYKAAALFFEQAGNFHGLKIEILKNIPMGAGLGGGSADAAAVLIGLNELTGNPFSPSELETLALPCGADVPFCMKRGTYLAEGLGEILTPLPSLPECFIVIAKPNISFSTKSVFESLVLRDIIHHPHTDGVISALHEHSLYDVAIRAYNVLEYAVRERYRELDAYKGIMLDCGADGSAMTGSGSAFFGIFTKKVDAIRAAEQFSEQGFFSFVSVPVTDKFL